MSQSTIDLDSEDETPVDCMTTRGVMPRNARPAPVVVRPPDVLPEKKDVLALQVVFQQLAEKTPVDRMTEPILKEIGDAIVESTSLMSLIESNGDVSPGQCWKWLDSLNGKHQELKNVVSAPHNDEPKKKLRRRISNTSEDVPLADLPEVAEAQAEAEAESEGEAVMEGEADMEADFACESQLFD